MRLLPGRITLKGAIDLLLSVVDGGVTVFHTAWEYESFDFFAEVMTKVQTLRPASQLTIIGKIGVPHFGVDHFEPAEFEAQLDRYLRAFNRGRLDVAQWSLRFDLKQEDRRVAIFDSQSDIMGDTYTRLRDSGKLGALISFPYTMTIGQRSLEAPWCDGLALYVNPLERRLTELLDLADARGKPVVGIRPFASGRGLASADDLDPDDQAALSRLVQAWPEESAVGRAIRYATAHPAVSGTVVSITTLAHAASVLGAVRHASMDIERFHFVTSG
jgi:aryl-alcohol dehydrogenase-like predicted oxidoreductase